MVDISPNGGVWSGRWGWGRAQRGGCWWGCGEGNAVKVSNQVAYPTTGWCHWADRNRHGVRSVRTGDAVRCDLTSSRQRPFLAGAAERVMYQTARGEGLVLVVQS